MFSQDDNASLFTSYWNAVKGKVQQLLDLPGLIEQRKGQLIVIMAQAQQAGDSTTYNQANASFQRLTAMKATATDIVNKINSYLPTWTEAEQAQVGGFGFLPIVLGVAAIGALAYVAVQGLALLKSYEQESKIIDGIPQKKYSVQEAQGLIKATQPPATFQLALGTGLTVLPILALAAGAWWFFGRRST